MNERAYLRMGVAIEVFQSISYRQFFLNTYCRIWACLFIPLFLGIVLVRFHSLWVVHMNSTWVAIGGASDVSCKTGDVNRMLWQGKLWICAHMYCSIGLVYLPSRNTPIFEGEREEWELYPMEAQRPRPSRSRPAIPNVYFTTVSTW